MTAVARSGIGCRGAVAFAIIVTIAGCQTETGDAEAGLDRIAPGVELVGSDVEAPDIFQVTEPGLWDGRPSLGGVWVAHPDVAEPERVIIRNTVNGASVVGALFRRERDNPGPALQVSSDAAGALGMLAGAPTVLTVTALRRDESAPAAPGEVLPPTEAIAAPEAIATAPLDPLAPEGDTAPAAPAPVAATLSSGDLQRPFVQIGIFSVEENAEAARTAMEGQGLQARVVAQESQGRQFWRVLVGPAGSESERAELLDRVEAEGFPDAYFVQS